MGNLDDLVRQARATVDAVANDPEGRFQLRANFYQRYGFLPEGAGYGNSELAFMRWEIVRGVLDPLDSPTRKGSPWWRDVNLSLCFDAELARLIHEATADVAPPAGSARWLAYLREPSERTWYSAHNGSIVAGYLAEVQAALAESEAERDFMNIVLYRVLYAQAMVNGQTFLGALGRILADPILPAVHIITDVPDFYPRDYPLTARDGSEVEGDSGGLLDHAVRLFDDDLIVPHATELYAHSATELGIPDLIKLAKDGKPSYPTF